MVDAAYKENGKEVIKLTTEAQRQGLGSFAELGFTLEHEGNETVRLLHDGEFVTRFSQLGVTQERLQAECANHLAIKHGWGGALWPPKRQDPDYIVGIRACLKTVEQSRDLEAQILALDQIIEYAEQLKRLAKGER